MNSPQSRYSFDKHSLTFFTLQVRNGPYVYHSFHMRQYRGIFCFCLQHHYYILPITDGIMKCSGVCWALCCGQECFCTGKTSALGTTHTSSVIDVFALAPIARCCDFHLLIDLDWNAATDGPLPWGGLVLTDVHCRHRWCWCCPC